MGIEYRETKEVDLDQLVALIGTAGWIRGDDRARLARQVSGALWVVSAWDGARLVGFARAVSDGVAFAYLADVYVHESARGAGLGTALVRSMIEDGPGRDFRWVLFTQDAHGLYERFGFSAPDETAMVRPAVSREGPRGA